MAISDEQKKEIVQGLCKSVADKLCSHIDAGHVPTHFDGFELRWMLAEIFDSEQPARSTPERQARYRQYKKDSRRASYEHDIFR